MILVDVGVWLAATWGRHVHHHVARHWFEKATDDLILCRVTQMSLLRLITNPSILGEDAVTRSEAWRVIDQIWSDDRVLWSEDAVFPGASGASKTDPVAVTSLGLSF